MGNRLDTHGIPFMKMHGLGNDFVVIDVRDRAATVTAELARAVGDRHTGIGFDQLATIHRDETADARLVFWNADGSTSAACGNATRCIARFLIDESGRPQVSLRTERGLLACGDAGNGLTRVNMGSPQLDWADVPLENEVDTLCLPIDGGPTAVGMGNPHCVFIVEDAEAADLPSIGAKYEHHHLFPQRTNVEIVEVKSNDTLRLRVWERGVGVTKASGSCACAAVVATARRGLTDRCCTVHLDGGTLNIDWRDDGVWMTGPTNHVCDGVLTPAFLDELQ